MAKMKTLRTFKVRETNNSYCIELVYIDNKFCTFVTTYGSVKLWHMSETLVGERLYFNKVVANNIGYGNK